MNRFYNYTILAIALLFAPTLSANAAADFEPYFYSVTAKNGDGIIIVLQRYGLSQHDCNFKKFLELNNLQGSGGLFINKEYKLPIKIYHYNGKSIRSTLGIADIEKAKRIQNYNEEILKKGLRSSSYTASKILWVPLHELDCEGGKAIESVPTALEKSKEDEAITNITESPVLVSKKVGQYELFGNKYESFDIFDHSLANQVFYISSGHGGPDPGAMCDDCSEQMCEDEYAYDVCLRLARNLMQHGATVHVIIQDKNDGIRDDKYLECDNDELTNSGKKLPLRQLDRLKQRADAINHLYRKYKKKGVKSQKAIMVHVDSRAKEKRQDVFFYYYDHNVGGEALAKNVFNTFESKYNQHRKDSEYKGYVDTRGLFMLRKVIPSSVYVELANIRNVADHKRIIYDYNRQALANWLFEGLTKE